MYFTCFGCNGICWKIIKTDKDTIHDEKAYYADGCL